MYSKHTYQWVITGPEHPVVLYKHYYTDVSLLLYVFILGIKTNRLYEHAMCSSSNSIPAPEMQNNTHPIDKAGKARTVWDI
jgi:hypothetical protein